MRNDGRIEPGQPLRTAISARGWNRAQDAADLVLGTQYSQEADPLSAVRLPCVRATLRDKGYFGEVRVFDDAPGGEPADSYFTASMPITADSLSGEDALLKTIVSYSLPPTLRSGVNNSGADANTGRRFAICVGNDSLEYAISGLAFTRVRMLNKFQKHARLPMSVYGYSGPEPDGCLDSAWWGPARIIGYVGTADGELSITTHEIPPQQSIAIRWALVHF